MKNYLEISIEISQDYSDIYMNGNFSNFSTWKILN
jgi:hypothetical protein